jgi:hypothetical protein
MGDLLKMLEDQLVAQRAAHIADINTIGHYLIAVMDGADYDGLVTDMGGELHHPLPARERMFLVTRTYKLEVHCKIAATDADAALEAVGEVSFDVDGRYEWHIDEEDIDCEDVTED